jgi:hypothetical protein
LAVLRLMIRSSFVACMTGKSAGFAPLRMNRRRLCPTSRVREQILVTAERRAARVDCARPTPRSGSHRTPGVAALSRSAFWGPMASDCRIRLVKPRRVCPLGFFVSRQRLRPLDHRHHFVVELAMAGAFSGNRSNRAPRSRQHHSREWPKPIQCASSRCRSGPSQACFRAGARRLHSAATSDLVRYSRESSFSRLGETPPYPASGQHLRQPVEEPDPKAWIGGVSSFATPTVRRSPTSHPFHLSGRCLLRVSYLAQISHG